MAWPTINALLASDAVLVVVEPGYFGLDSIVQFNKTLAKVREFYRPELWILGCLFNKSDPAVNNRTSLPIRRHDSNIKLLVYNDQLLSGVKNLTRAIAIKPSSS